MKKNLLLLLLMWLPASSFAYTVYNDTSHYLYVWDYYTHSWLSMAIA